MGLEISVGWLTVWMFGSLAVLLMAGLPLAFVTGGLACVFLFLFGDIQMLNILPSRIFPMMTDYQLSAIPLFIFMATMLAKAGVVEELFEALYKMLGGLKGGLASATIIASTIMAAMAGVIGATEVTMGILIPPSILAILFAVVAQQSVGELFIGAVIPGLILSTMYIVFVTVRSYMDPTVGPPLPPEERITFKEKLGLLQRLIAPILLVMLVLGVIFLGVATPVEAAGIGTFGAIVVAALFRRLNWQIVKEAAMTTVSATAMVLWIIFGATMFVGFYVVNGGQEFVNDALLATGFGPYGIVIVMMIILVVLGMFLDWVGILLLAVPIFMPLVKTMTFDGVFGMPGVAQEDIALWFGVVYMVNMQMSFLSPPFGYALFYLKSVAPPEVTMAQIFRASFPFLLLQALGLAICIIFPQVVLWLPKLVYG